MQFKHNLIFLLKIISTNLYRSINLLIFFTQLTFSLSVVSFEPYALSCFYFHANISSLYFYLHTDSFQKSNFLHCSKQFLPSVYASNPQNSQALVRYRFGEIDVTQLVDTIDDALFPTAHDVLAPRNLEKMWFETPGGEEIKRADFPFFLHVFMILYLKIALA